MNTETAPIGSAGSAAPGRAHVEEVEVPPGMTKGTGVMSGYLIGRWPENPPVSADPVTGDETWPDAPPTEPSGSTWDPPSGATGSTGRTGSTGSTGATGTSRDQERR